MLDFTRPRRGRLWVGVLICVLALAALPHDAWAHGGRPKPPPGSDPFAPPDMPPPPPPPAEPPVTEPPEEPPETDPPETDPPEMSPPETGDDAPDAPDAPPTTPPSTGPPTGAPPTTPPPSTPPGTRPPTVTPPTFTPPTAPRIGSPPRTRGKTSAVSQAWHTWWLLNRQAYLPSRADVERKRVGVVTGARKDTSALQDKARALAAKRWIVPYLLEQLDPRKLVDDEVRAAAVIALTKLANDEGAITLAFRWTRDRSASSMVRESAALSLGLIRRSDPALQVPATTLDRVRNDLLGVFDDPSAPWRPRTFAALALGLLGDQPFGEGIFARGLMTSRGLWMRLRDGSNHREESTALLTALGMQPAEGVPQTVKDQLRQIVMGKRVLRRSWPAAERSHALTTLVRLQSPGWPVWLMRVLSSRRAPHPVRRAAWIAIGGHAGSLTKDERRGIARMWSRAERNTRELVGKGLMRLAQGQLIAADFAAGDVGLIQDTQLGKDLLRQASGAQVDVRTFAMLGLGIAARAATDGPAARQFADQARVILGTAYIKRRGGIPPTAAAAIAMGLCTPSDEAAAAMQQRLAHTNTPEAERSACAVALALTTKLPAKLRPALVASLWDRRMPTLRQEAALALSFLAQRGESLTLLREFSDAGTSQWVLGQVAGAIGRLGDLRVVPKLIGIAQDQTNGDHARGLAIASLGLLADPEPIASLFRITRHANFPSRTVALDEASSIL